MAARARQQSFRLDDTPNEMAKLRWERDRLLREVTLRKAEAARLEEEQDEVRQRVASRAEPLFAEGRRLAAEIHAFFTEMITGGKLSKRMTAEVRSIYETMVSLGAVPPPPETWDQPPNAPGGRSAERPEGSRGAGDLRAVYRKVAAAIHPDKVQDEGEKATRTEVMKQVTAAYSDGDLALLLELESTWVSAEGQGAAEAQALKKTIARLGEQLAELEERVAAATPTHVMGRGRAKGQPKDPAKVLMAELAEEIEDLRGVHAFVRRFRDGDMKMAEFRRGPYAAIFGDLEAMFGPDDAPPRKTKARKTRKR